MTALPPESARSSHRLRQTRLALGFGLLEAIVALVILGGTGLTLFSWINSNLATASRLKDAERRAQSQLEAQAFLANLNPAMQPAGDAVFGKLRLSWRSETVEPLRDEFDQRGMLEPRWRLGLYRVSVRAAQTDDASGIEWQQLVAGWRLRGNGDAGPATASGR